MKFKLTNAAIENYGEQYRNVVYTVRSWSNHYVPAKTYFANPKHHLHGHPGYDGANKAKLYEAEGLPFAVYQWEINEV
jgi:hypothetical protein